jgi:type VI secretion system protein ImpE
MPIHAEDLIKSGDLENGLARLQEEIRAHPANGDLRVLLFQLLSVLGRWDRALTQLNVSGDMQKDAAAFATLYRRALEAEAFRAEVFAGKRTPLIFGEPPPWIGKLLQALALTAAGEYAAAAPLREDALAEAEAVPVSIDGTEAAWLADADTRLGPVFEAIFSGKYYWVPMQRVAEMRIEAPVFLKDRVWINVHIQWTNHGKVDGLMPVRYPGTEAAADAALRLARSTTWQELPEGAYHGLGGRLFATDVGEFPLLGVRHLLFHHPEQKVTIQDILGSGAPAS